MKDLYLSLGTNLGNRKENIHQALTLLNKEFGVNYRSLSHIIETEAWGFEGEPFLNCVVLYEIDMISAFHVLEICKKIEKKFGRDEEIEFDDKGKRIYKSRVIDIDILFFGEEIIKEENLIIPHPLIKDRDFVKIPLKEIAKVELKAAFPEILE